MHCRVRKLTGILAVSLLMAAWPVYAGEIELPRTVIWSAYPTGTSGYSQAVAIGSVLQREYRTNLRVIPGRNDVSRLSPLRSGRVHFSAGGSEAVYAQEGMLNFGERAWGPQPLRAVMWNLSDGCSFTFATAADADIETVHDMRGKRLTWVQGAPSLNNGSRALLAYAGLSWDDVEKVEVGGYPSSVQAVIDNRADAVGGSCNSAPFRQLEASPRGLHFVRFPHDDEAAVERVLSRLPWFLPHVATEGPTIPTDGVEMFSSPYPFLITMPDAEEELVYAMTRVLHRHYEQYKNNAPGGTGWAMDRQHFEKAFVPYHPGAVRYFREIGEWSEAAEQRQQENLARQQVLADAWQQYVSDAPENGDAFMQGWMRARHAALQEADMIPIAEQW